MHDAVLRSLSLLDVSGYIIIAIIIAFLSAGILITVSIRARYASIGRELERAVEPGASFRSQVLNRITDETVAVANRHAFEINSQAIVDHCFQQELKWSLIGERFVKSVIGLTIILGLVGTFYGLTLSIGRLVSLIAGDVSGATEIAESLTKGLTQALSGMSVAFSSSLFGILSAIVMTLVTIVLNVADARTALMAQMEAYLDNVLLPSVRASQPVQGGVAAAGGAGSNPLVAQRLERSVAGFAQSVAQLEHTVARFETALQHLASGTGEFREFNLHLKDNIQRMSLSFGDLSETLKQQVRALVTHKPNRTDG